MPTPRSPPWSAPFTRMKRAAGLRKKVSNDSWSRCVRRRPAWARCLVGWLHGCHPDLDLGVECRPGDPGFDVDSHAQAACGLASRPVEVHDPLGRLGSDACDVLTGCGKGDGDLGHEVL